jgi:hypothetical protein
MGLRKSGIIEQASSGGQRTLLLKVARIATSLIIAMVLVHSTGMSMDMMKSNSSGQRGVESKKGLMRLDLIYVVEFEEINTE